MITDACTEYLWNNDEPAVIDLSDIINPHYAMDLDNFKVSYRSKDDKSIFITEPVGRTFTYSTIPGQIKLNKWPGTNNSVDTLNSIMFSVQPQDSSETKKIKLVIDLPHEDFPILANTCEMDHHSF